MSFAIAIDGPSGAGKSTVAKLAAQKLGYIYVDTGAMYRAVALYCIRNGIEPGDEEAVSSALEDINIDLGYSAGSRVLLNGEDVTDLLRTQEIAEGSSKVAVHDSVRNKLVALQKIIGETKDVVMDGRDITTNVLPNAQVRIYMDASVDERTKRRINELAEKGISGDYDTVRREIEDRDYRDMNRKSSPLVKSKTATEIVTDGMSINDVLEEILKLHREKIR